MKTKTNKAKQVDQPAVAVPVGDQERQRMIAEAAYFRALQRDFRHGDALDDWCRAEREIDQMLLAGTPPARAGSGKGAGVASRRQSAASPAREAAAKR